MMGLEPTTFCMASRRSSQLSYSRASGEYSPGRLPRIGFRNHRTFLGRARFNTH